MKYLLFFVIVLLQFACSKTNPFPGKHPNNLSIMASIDAANSTSKMLAIVGDLGVDTLVHETIVLQSPMNCMITGGVFSILGSTKNDVKEIVVAGIKFPVIGGIATVSGISINLPANKATSIRYLLSFNGTKNGAKSGDTVYVVPISVNIKGVGEVLLPTVTVAPLLVVNSGIVSVRIRPSKRNIVSPGITDICIAEIIVAGPHFVSLSGFPIALEANDYVVLNTEANSLTAIDSVSGIPFVINNDPFGVKGGDRQARFADASLHPGTNVISFSVAVNSIGGTGLNNIGVFINDADYLSWGDIAGSNGNPTSWITGNAFIPGYIATGLTVVGRPALH